MDHKLAPKPPASRPADARIVKTRTALRDALTALASERPFEQLTIAEITQRASVGYATFFRHYPDKEALLADIAEALVVDLIGFLGPLMQTTGRTAAAHELARFVEARRALCHALLVGAGDALRREITMRALRLSAEGHVDLPEDMPRELASVHAVGATINILAWWLERGQTLGAEALGDLLERLVFAPLAPRG